MRLTGIFLLAILLVTTTKLSAQVVSFSGKDVTLPTVFDAITRQTGFAVFYKDDLMQQAKKVSLNLKNVSVDKIMQEALKDQPLTYRIVEKTIVVKQKEAPQKGADNNEQDSGLPPIDVKGRVLDEGGRPVFASIVIKGTNIGTTSNENGEFQLKAVDENAVLVISGVSIESFEVKVDGRKAITVNARNNVVAAEEVLVSTGYQKVKPQNYIGAYAQLDSAGLNLRAGVPLLNRLEGTIPGILFDKKAGTSSLELIQVRGLSTLNSSKAPLIVVDNFPYTQDLSLINPYDVESITVLRDAAATSIWGSRAGNGVIVITTKKGRYKQPTSLSFSSNLMVQGKPDPYYYPQMSVADFVDVEVTLFKNGYYDPQLANRVNWPVVSPVVELLSKRRAGQISALDSTRGIDGFKTLDFRNDLLEHVYRPGVQQQHYVQLKGGSELFNYSFSSGYNHSLNNIKGSRPDDGISLNLATGFRPLASLEFNTAIRYAENNTRSYEFALPNIYPYAQLADEDGGAMAIPFGRRLGYVDTAGGGQLADWKYRPLDEIRYADNRINTALFQLNTGLVYKPLRWLDVVLSYQYSRQGTEGRNYQNVNSYEVRDMINNYFNPSATLANLRNPVPVSDVFDVSNAQIKSHNGRLQLNFNKTFSARHLITAMGAAEASQTRTSGTASRFYGYNKETGIYSNNIDYATLYPTYSDPTALQRVPVLQNPLSTNRRILSFIGNVSYAYNGRYTLYASAKRDGANIFGANTNGRWKPLWSAGAAWDVSKEAFYKLAWMPALRVKFSYGYSGNQGNASALPTLFYLTYRNFINNMIQATPEQAANPNLRWEKVRIINQAVEFALFNNRLSGSINIYQKQSTDLIGNLPAAPSTGFRTLQNVNVASLKGNGLEIQLNSLNISRKTFQWRTAFVLSHARTVITKLYQGQFRASQLTSYGVNGAEGMIAYGLGSYRWAGLDATGNPQGYLGKNLSTDYAAISNDSIANQVFHGSAIPLVYGQLSNTLTWGRFGLTANVSYRLNFYYRRPTIHYSDLANAWRGHADYAKRWQKPGDEAFTNVPSFVYPLNSERDHFYGNSEVNVSRGDNVKLSDLQFSYNWLPKARNVFKSVSIFMNANNLNLILWRMDKYDIDPDFSGGGSFLAPTPKNLTLGVNLTL